MITLNKRLKMKELLDKFEQEINECVDRKDCQLNCIDLWCCYENFILIILNEYIKNNNDRDVGEIFELFELDSIFIHSKGNFDSIKTELLNYTKRVTNKLGV